jgi:membrane-associated protein
VAAILGDSVNYAIGHRVGQKMFRYEESRWLNPRHLQRTHEFYERYGPITIVLARFVPIVRTFAPFVAGVGAMSYGKFFLYNIVGGIAWVALFIFGGYLVAEIDFVKNHPSLIYITIIFISVMPMAFEYWRARRQAKRGEGRGERGEK